MYYVSKYEVTRNYGGPEEGGWWYDLRKFIEVNSTHPTRDQASIIASELNAKARADNQQADGARYQGRYSVANNIDTVYYVEDNPGARDDTDKPTPHYE